MTAQIIPFTTEQAWLAERAKDITSTESAALFGLSPYVTRYELWHRKRGNLQTDFATNDRMLWGNRLEAAIAHGIADEQGWQIQPMKDYRRIEGERTGSSFDFEILNHPDGPAHLEIKNVDYLAFRDGWLEHDDGTVEAPAHIEMQVQHQMLVSGYERSFIGAFIGGNRYVIIERLRDADVIAAIRHRIRQFWRDVDDGIEPPPLMPEDAAAVIRLNQFAEPGKIVDATDDANIAALVDRMHQASTAKKRAEEDEKVAKAELLAAIGDAEKVLLNGWSISAGTVADTPPTVITADMIGQTYGGRAGYRGCRLNKRKDAK